MVNKLKVYGVESLLQVVAFLQGKLSLQPTIVNTREEFYAAQATMGDDFADVKGQDAVNVPSRWLQRAVTTSYS